jgi:hypothetical protein
MRPNNIENEKAASGGRGLLVHSTTKEKSLNVANTIIRQNHETAVDPDIRGGIPYTRISSPVCRYCGSDQMLIFEKGICNICGNPMDVVEIEGQISDGGVE